MIPSKRDIFDGLLAQERSIQVHFDPRGLGVEVPSHLREGPQLMLRFGMLQTCGWTSTPEKISGGFTFNGRHFDVVIPWATVFLMVGDDTKRGRLWSEDVPAELQVTLKEARDIAATSPTPAPVPAAASQPPRNNVISFAAARARLRPNAPVKGSPFRPVL